MEFIIEYEIFGYLALISNVWAAFQKSIRSMLNIYIISGVLFLSNIYILSLDIITLYIASLGFSLTLISRMLINEKRIKNILLKLSPLVMLLIVYIAGMNIIGYISGVGFFLATMAKLQDKLLNMRILFILSGLTWMQVMIILECNSLIIYYVVFCLILGYKVIFSRGEGVLKKFFFQDRENSI